MTEVSIAEAKAKLSEIVARARMGETQVITSRGKPVAKIVAPDAVISRPSKVLDLHALDSFLASMPASTPDGSDTVVKLRDGYRS